MGRPMSVLVLVRHGESRWKVGTGFTGGVEVPLSVAGMGVAPRCAVHCKPYAIDVAFTSALERAHETLFIVLSQQDRTGIMQHGYSARYGKWIRASIRCGEGDIPVFANPLLNERYYGALQGMEKGAAERKFGKAKVLAWRRGFAARPPGGESLADTFRRVSPYFSLRIQSRLRAGQNVLLAGHGNTLRAIIKRIEGLSDEEISFVDLPQAAPLVYEYRSGSYRRIAGEYRLDRPLR